MYNNSNPAELYQGTTWEKITSKYIRASDGTTPLVTGGTNFVKISKANLPAEKLQVESFQLGRGTQEITGRLELSAYSLYFWGYDFEGAFYKDTSQPGYTRNDSSSGNSGWYNIGFKASNTWTGMSTPANPYTTAMGSGTPLSIEPEHITLHVWKRLS